MTQGTQSLPKRARLRSPRDYQRVRRQSRRFHGAVLTFEIMTRPPQEPRAGARLGITVSRKYGPSNKRNFFKRQVREAFRRLRHTLPRQMDLHVLPRAPARTSEEALSQKSVLSDFSLILHAHT